MPTWGIRNTEQFPHFSIGEHSGDDGRVSGPGKKFACPLDSFEFPCIVGFGCCEVRTPRSRFGEQNTGVAGRWARADTLVHTSG